MPVVELQLDGRKVRAPVWIMPGHADRSVTVYLGHGRQHAGRIGGTVEQQVGFNAYLLRTADRPWFASGTPGGRRRATRNWSPARKRIN